MILLVVDTQKGCFNENLYAFETVKNNIKKMIIVVGYKSDVLIDFIHSKFNKDNLNGMEIEFIENS